MLPTRPAWIWCRAPHQLRFLGHEERWRVSSRVRFRLPIDLVQVWRFYEPIKLVTDAAVLEVCCAREA